MTAAELRDLVIRALEKRDYVQAQPVPASETADPDRHAAAVVTVHLPVSEGGTQDEFAVVVTRRPGKSR